MEPRPFARLSVGALGLRFTQSLPTQPAQAEAATTTIACNINSSTVSSGAPYNNNNNNAAQSSWPPSPPCFCEIKLSHFGKQVAPVPFAASAPKGGDTPDASFYLDEPALTKLLSGSCLAMRPAPRLQVVVYSGRGRHSCLLSSFCGSGLPGAKKKLGTFSLPVGMELASPKGVLLHSGWSTIAPSLELHLLVKVELDPRYIFQFDGEPELSPQIVQIQGNIRQPIFTCKFTRDRSFRSRAGQMDGYLGNDWGAASHQGGGKDRSKKERKGWLILIYDLSGAAVAAASMVTPFVPTSGSDKVSRSNPGAWLIMRAGPMGEDDWRPWGKLEAWREKGGSGGGGGGLGCRFHLVAPAAAVAEAGHVAETVISTQKGGSFLIDTARLRPASPPDSPNSSSSHHLLLPSPPPLLAAAAGPTAGFVMSALVQGEGKSSKPHVQLATRHVSCVEDAAVFMALAAAVDLSMDACLPFSKKLGKSFRSGLGTSM